MSPASKCRDRRLRPWLGAALWIGGLAGSAMLDDPRLRFPSYLICMAAAGWGWWALISAWSHRYSLAAWAAGWVARGLALSAPPVFSDDVFRYVYEGRLTWLMGPRFPFVVPPAGGPLAEVPAWVLDEAWLRINHPELPTLYPPLAQLWFAAGAALGDLTGLGGLLGIKIALTLAEATGVFILARVHPAAVPILWLCPLAITELARDGHADGLAMAGACVALALAGRSSAWLGWFACMQAKLWGAVGLAVAGLTDRRAWALLAAGTALAAWPLLLGAEAGVGLGAYAGRWQGGDGAFTLMEWTARGALGGAWAQLGPFSVTAQQLARVATAGLGLALFITLARRRTAPSEMTGLLVFAMLLLGPTLHPWYATWALPFAAAVPKLRPPVVTLAVLAPLLHAPAWVELLTGRWQEPWAAKLVVHVGAWAALGWAIIEFPGRTRGSR